MTSSTHSRRRRRTRLFKAVTIALAALALTAPTSALADWPASEKTAGLAPSPEASAPITSEKLKDLPDLVADGTVGPNAPTFVPIADDKAIVPTRGTRMNADAPDFVPAWGRVRAWEMWGHNPSRSCGTTAGSTGRTPGSPPP
jgi:hypothetical protein